MLYDGDDGDNDGGFFPIDGQLGGNDGADRDGTPHNYSFTLALNDSVTYKAGADQELSWTGDDDIWVFNGRSEHRFKPVSGPTSRRIHQVHRTVIA